MQLEPSCGAFPGRWEGLETDKHWERTSRADTISDSSMVDERVTALVARGVAPIKPEYLCAVADARVAVPPLPSSEEPPEVAQRKSKKQMKRVSRQTYCRPLQLFP